MEIFPLDNIWRNAASIGMQIGKGALITAAVGSAFEALRSLRASGTNLNNTAASNAELFIRDVPDPLAGMGGLAVSATYRPLPTWFSLDQLKRL